MSAMEVVSLIPKSLGEAKELAKELAVSQLIPAALRKSPADVLAIVLFGAELGLQPMQSLRGVSLENGKMGMYADTMAGLCLSKPAVCEKLRCVELTDVQCTYEAKRRGEEPERLTWSMKDASLAKLLHKDNWQKYPKRMLRARCLAAICRQVFPDLMAGVYDPDELPDEPQKSTGGAPERAEKVTPSTPQNAEAMIETLKASVALTEPPAEKRRRLLILDAEKPEELGPEYDRLAAVLEKADTWPQLRAASNLAADKGANLNEKEKSALSAIYKLRHAEIATEKERIVELAEMSSAEIPS